jgi:hypothetical protein
MSRVERTEAGFVVDAELLAAAFRLPPGSVRTLMRDGRITSRCEAGVGEDAGRWRLTFYHGGRVCRLTVDADGALIGRATFPAPPRPRDRRKPRGDAP